MPRILMLARDRAQQILIDVIRPETNIRCFVLMRCNGRMALKATTIWIRCITAAKVIGLALLGAYFFRVPIHVEWEWVGVYVAIALAVALAGALVVNPLLERLLPSQRFDPQPYGASIIEWVKRKPLRHLALLPGEDGFFFVPLVWYGITPIAAAISTALFAAAHYPQFPIKHCVGKFVALFSIAVVVLPHGLATVIVGHLLVDVLAFALGSKVFASKPAVDSTDA